MDLPRNCAGVIYDLDGTLLNTIPDIALAMNAELAAHGLPVRSEDEYPAMVGWGLLELARRAVPADAATPELVHACYRGMKARYAERPVVRTVPYDGIPSLLTEVGRRGYLQLVFSNKADELTREVVRRTLPKGAFAIVRGSRDGVPQKPDPAGVHAVCAEAGTLPENLVYLGDSDVDMETAVAAGCYPVGASWGYRNAETLRRSGAAQVIDRPIELLFLLPVRAANGS